MGIAAPPNGRTAGYDFSVTQPRVVTRLGHWDRDLDGIEEERPIALWDEAGNELAMTTFLPGTDAELIDGFRYLDIEPILLMPGQSYTVGILYTTNSGAIARASTADPSNFVQADGVAIGTPRLASFDSTLQKPLGASSGEPGFFGPNVDLEPLSVLAYEAIASGSLGALIDAPARTVGFRFTVDETQYATQLGVWDQGGDGLEENIPVGLWDSSGTLLATTVLSAGASAGLVDEFRYQDIEPPVELAPGETYTVGAYLASDSVPAMIDVSDLATVAGVNYVDSAITSADSAMLGFPDSSLAGRPGIFGGNLRIARDSLHCGDGVLQADRGEACDGGVCCDPGTCQLASAGLLCRAGSGDSCDPDETCDGASADCPADVVRASGEVCRVGSGDLCDPDETCSGVAGAACPGDTVAAADTVCRAGSGDLCDPDETCSGVAGAACPGDTVAAADTVCRAGSGVCDLEESCDGVAGNPCPTDLSVADGTSCEAGDFCTSGDSCQAGACVEGTGSPCDSDETCVEADDACAGCGDGLVDTGEACDDGPDNSDSAADACRTDCTEATCGDGVVDSDEECDDGAASTSCTADCMLILDDGGDEDAGMVEDAGTTAPDAGADAGLEDGGRSAEDGGPGGDPEPDAGVHTGDGAIDEDAGPDDGASTDDGCSCAAPGSASGATPLHGLLFASFGALAALRLRRRKSRPVGAVRTFR
ncbi:MAG: DUF4082 domain-containing protein [Myxococcales bacterium]|nr:DUF4082 domain-containing protein [Myxococcales bacterium]